MSLLNSLVVCVCLLLAVTLGEHGAHVDALEAAGAPSQGVRNKAEQIEYQDTIQGDNDPESTTDDPDSSTDDPESTTDDPESTSDDLDYFYDDDEAYDEDKESTSTDDYEAADDDDGAARDSPGEATHTSDDAACQCSDDEVEDAAPPLSSARREGQA